MSIEIGPKQTNYTRIVDSQSFEIDRHKIITLVDNLKPLHQGIRINNKTKTCKVVMGFDGAGTVIIEVTNEEEDNKFRFESEAPTGQTTENT